MDLRISECVADGVVATASLSAVIRQSNRLKKHCPSTPTYQSQRHQQKGQQLGMLINLQLKLLVLVLLLFSLMVVTASPPSPLTQPLDPSPPLIWPLGPPVPPYPAPWPPLSPLTRPLGPPSPESAQSEYHSSLIFLDYLGGG